MNEGKFAELYRLSLLFALLTYLVDFAEGFRQGAEADLADLLTRLREAGL